MNPLPIIAVSKDQLGWMVDTMIAVSFIVAVMMMGYLFFVMLYPERF